jgi:hypothetical protein
LARVFFSRDELETRVRSLLALEAEVIAALPLRPALH